MPQRARRSILDQKAARAPFESHHGLRMAISRRTVTLRTYKSDEQVGCFGPTTS